MQSVFMGVSVFYVFIFITGIIGANKIKISRKMRKLSFVLFALSLSLIAYGVTPPPNWDLARHFEWLDIIRKSDLSLFEFLFQNKSGIGGWLYKNLIGFNFLRYIVAKMFTTNNAMPFLCVLLEYLIIGYIFIDWSKDNNYKGRVNFTSLLLCFALFPFPYAVSGIRNTLAVAIVSLGIYQYLYKGKSIAVFIVFAAIAVTIHPAVFFAVPFVFFVRYETGIKGFLIVFGVTLFIDLATTYFASSGFSFLALMARTYKHYTSENQYRGDRYALYGNVLIIGIFLFVYLIAKKNEGIRKNWDKRQIAVYSFLTYYMCFILGNIGNYDMVTRPSYLLGVFSPALTSLIVNTEKKSRSKTKLILYIVKLAVCGICIYVCYKHTIILLQGY